ncbi:hypothetical protein [Mycolicibacterium aubagnense]|uniref:Uncharacterized protein n=1 Tax=Mycolicibacterium aubagnense TaxID=319707 RepID=A0ABN5YKM6_9MYCO|nr:hypothetical protein [Mycolicibacterium aubagnense]TLH49003.1 hypothetical protein C1S80_29425 [Mycolicibacterium aubagnense]BBX82206.1 hypothetical protein MAUB_00790 [Mycolicibacterium aubagnense]
MADSDTERDATDAHRLAAVAAVLEILRMQRQHCSRCVTAEGIDAVRREAIEEIRAITAEGWAPEQVPGIGAVSWFGRDRVGEL